jgi:hypothetical protein
MNNTHRIRHTQTQASISLLTSTCVLSVTLVITDAIPYFLMFHLWIVLEKPTLVTRDNSLH